MEFVDELKEYLRKIYQKSYEDYCKMLEDLKLVPKPFEEFIEELFNQRINCGGYALEIDSCIFLHGISFERAVSSLLEQMPFIRLLGNTNLLEDEYIVKYRSAEDGLGHHFVKIKDGIVTEKGAVSEIREFEEWVDVLKDRPEATFAVKKNHDRMFDGKLIYLKDGKDFDDVVNEAYQNRQNHFQYHCQNYSFKKCVPIIQKGLEDYISNTKTEYCIRKNEMRQPSEEVER